MQFAFVEMDFIYTYTAGPNTTSVLSYLNAFSDMRLGDFKYSMCLQNLTGLECFFFLSGVAVASHSHDLFGTVFTPDAFPDTTLPLSSRLVTGSDWVLRHSPGMEPMLDIGRPLHYQSSHLPLTDTGILLIGPQLVL